MKVESNGIENNETKGDIAHHEQQFLILLQWFQKLSAADESNCDCKREQIKGTSSNFT